MSNFTKIFKWEMSCSIRTDRQIDDSSSFRDIAKAPKEWEYYRGLGEATPPLEGSVTLFFGHVNHP